MKKAIEKLLAELLNYKDEIHKDSREVVHAEELENLNLQMIVELQKILLDDWNQPKEEPKSELTPDSVEWTLQVEGKYHSKIKLRSDIAKNLDEIIVIESLKDQFSVFNIFKDDYFIICDNDLKVINLSLKPDTNKEELFEDKKILIPIWHNNLRINEIYVDLDASDEAIRAKVAFKESSMLTLYINMGIPYKILIETDVHGNKYAIIIQKRIK
jgi:hypothetical protein